MTKCGNCGMDAAPGRCAICYYVNGWTCPFCTLVNDLHLDQCAACEAPRHKAAPKPAPKPAPGPPVVKQGGRSHSEGYWECTACTRHNSLTDTKCVACLSNAPFVSMGYRSEPPARPAVNATGAPRLSQPARTPNSSQPAEPSRRDEEHGWRESLTMERLFQKQQALIQTNIDSAIAFCSQMGSSFIDSEFQPGDASLGGQLHGYRWMRPVQLQAGGWSVILDDANCEDIMQGELGDCWFLSSLSVVASRPHLIDRLLLNKKYNDQGVYCVRLFINGEWNTIMIDDSLPVKYQQIAFGKGKRQQLWVSLIEKAFAKAHGSYSKIISGMPKEAFVTLTGAPCVNHPFHDTNSDLDLIWATLLSSHQAGFLIAANCGVSDIGDEAYKRVGLIKSHAYSVIDVREVNGTRLMLLRNPWGTTVWNGDWSCNSPQWTPEMRRLLPQAGTGGFWITYFDVIKYFVEVDVCKEQQTWSWHSERCDLPEVPSPQVSFPTIGYAVRVQRSTQLQVSFHPIVEHLNRRERGTPRHWNCLILSCPKGQERVAKEYTSVAHMSTFQDTSEEVILSNLNHTYIIVPYSLYPAVDCRKCTMSMYTSGKIDSRCVPINPHLFTVGLQGIIYKIAGPDDRKQLYRGIEVLYPSIGDTQFFMISNLSDQVLKITLDNSNSNGVLYIRSPISEDTSHPHTQQILAATPLDPNARAWLWSRAFQYQAFPPHQSVASYHMPPEQSIFEVTHI